VLSFDQRTDLATKAELKAGLIKWMVGTMGFMTTLFVFVVKFL
jgi:hypothetical protein